MYPNNKPFDLNSAKSGAPVGLPKLGSGYEVEVLKYGEKKIFGVLTDVHGNESAEYWNLDGTYGLAAVDGALSLVMLPLGYCEGKPVFVGDELIDKEDGHKVAATPLWKNMDGTLWKWPKPEPKYPETRMNAEEINQAGGRDPISQPRHIKMANAAIKRAIQDGDVFTKQQVTAVLEELRNICDRHANPLNIRDIVDGTDWDAILKAGM